MTGISRRNSKFRELLRILILSLLSIGLSIYIFGPAIIEHWAYVLRIGNGTTLSIGGWYLILGVFLFVIQFFFTIREWYHHFKREMMNLACIIVSLALLFYMAYGYYSLCSIEYELNLARHRWSLQGFDTAFPIGKSFMNLKTSCVIMGSWALISLIFFSGKLIIALRM